MLLIKNFNSLNKLKLFRNSNANISIFLIKQREKHTKVNFKKLMKK